VEVISVLTYTLQYLKPTLGTPAFSALVVVFIWWTV